MKDVIWPGRRKFIKRAPLVFASGLTLAAMPKVAKAFGAFAGSSFVGGSPTQPTLASVNGFNTCTFFDDFDSVNTIDVNNSLQPGYKWYVTDQIVSGVPRTMAAGNFSCANSVLTMNPSGIGGWMVTRGFAGTVGQTNLVGQSFNNGWYSEVSLALSTLTKPNGGAEQCCGIPNGPAVWFNDTQLMLNQSNTGMTACPLGEIDIVEYSVFTQGVQDAGLLKWGDLGGSYPAPLIGNYNQSVNPGGVGLLSFNTFGCLYKTKAQGGGTGSITLYFNGIATKTQTFTLNSLWDVFDKSPLGQTLYIGTEPNWPIYVDYAMVWQ